MGCLLPSRATGGESARVFMDKTLARLYVAEILWACSRKLGYMECPLPMSSGAFVQLEYIPLTDG